jgi:hypothetical protein
MSPAYLPIKRTIDEQLQSVILLLLLRPPTAVRALPKKKKTLDSPDWTSNAKSTAK